MSIRPLVPMMRTFVVGAVLVVLAACASGSDGSNGDELTDDPAAVTVDAVPAPDDDVLFQESDETTSDENSTDDQSTGDGGSDDVESSPAEPNPPTSSIGSKDVVTRSADAVGEGVQPVGPSTVTVRITSTDGEVCDVCMWLADSSAERSTGLMGVTDLGGPVGMAFSWNSATDGRFFMLGTPTPLSIAWFAESGEHVGQTDMDPCLTDDASTCERYGADAPYTLAIEMFEGQLDVVGIAPGATVELVDGTESPTCVLGA